MELLENVTIMPGVLFREIHKNGCLKRYSSERRTGFPRKTDRVWVVFCVHDDTEAFLEFYPDHKIALTHKPECFVPLHNVLHVSPSICGQADEFEFAVTLPTQVIRLAASSWDSMMEWVESIRNKLRELRVLAPKENVYSKMPEPRHALLPTRDPTSPLPLPPIGALGLVPGVENPARTSAAQLSSPDSGSSQASTPILQATGESANDNVFRTEIVSPRSEATPGPSGLSVRSGSSSTKPQTEVTQPAIVAIGDSGGNVTREQEVRKKESTPTTAGSSIVILNNEIPANIISRPAVPPPIDLEPGPSSGNVTVIEVPPPPSPHYEHLFIAEEQLRIPPETRAKLERVNSSGLIPRVPSRPSKDPERSANAESARNRDRPPLRSPESPVSSPSPKSNDPSQSRSAMVKLKAGPSKEPLKQTSVVQVGAVSVVSVQSSVSNKSAFTSVSASTNGASPAPDLHQVPPISAALQPTPSGFDVKDIPLIGGHQRRRRRSSSSDAGAGPTPRGISGADLIRVVPSEVVEAPDISSDSPRLTLRETQVCQLRREMEHPGGVRLPLRRKDCFGGIALVDVSNSVWVAGWKQREHPLLYNALHIGDQVLSIGEFPVRSSAEAQKLLKGPAGPTVELVVRRLPLGKVLTLQRPRGAGAVGLQVDPTSPGEVAVTPGGVAARAGLAALTPTMDGLGLTTWTLTEINGRPLNLMCKVADVTTRLNSVGKELSILVQPSDFIKQLRKQLKNMRSYKDYLLQ